RGDPAHRSRPEPAGRGHARGARPGGGEVVHMPSWFGFVLRRLISSIVMLLLLTLITCFAFSRIPSEPPAFLIHLRNAPPACSGPVGWAEHLAIPWIVFAVFFVALYSRMIRARMLEALDQDYVRTARAKGAPQRRVLFKHALPNTVLPIVTMLAMDIGTAIG